MPEPAEDRPAAPGSSAGKPAVTEEAPPGPDPAAPPGPAETDDPYAQLENFLSEPIVLEGPAPGAPPASSASSTPLPQQPSSSPPPQPDPAPTGDVFEAIRRLEQFAQRLATRFEALAGPVRDGSTRTLDSLRRLGERMGAELAMLEKRAVNLELTMARLRSTTEALELSLRKLPDPTGTASRAPAVPPPPNAAPGEPAPVSTADAVPETPTEPQHAAPPDALFTLEEEVPPADWDEPPRDESQWP